MPAGDKRGVRPAARLAARPDPIFPAAVGGDSAELDPFHASEGHASRDKATTPWAAYPGLYQATCQNSDGASWLQVTKASPSDHRPVVEESSSPAYGGHLGADWGFHIYDVNLALGNLVTDVAAAEASWTRK